MIILVTGTVGIDKKQYLEGVCELAQSRGKEILLCNIGDMMYAEAPDIAEGRILDISLKRLHSLRRSVMKDIIAKSKTVEHLIVNTHATFRWRHGLFPAFDFYQIRELDPDMYVCMIDGASALHLRLTDAHPIRHSLKDLLVWREEEVLATEMMQMGTNEDAEIFCLARGEGRGTVETFYRLAFEKERGKAYIGFPMTHVMDQPALIEEINGFRDEMKKCLTCFDPGDLEEAFLPCLAEKAVEEGRSHIEVTALGRRVSLETGEVLQIRSDINSQIYARDFALIDQADMIISYVPEMPDGRAVISSGVERELHHAHEAAKDVYVVWTPKADPSVFITQTATRVFSSTGEAVEFFGKKEPVNSSVA